MGQEESTRESRPITIWDVANEPRVFQREVVLLGQREKGVYPLRGVLSGRREPPRVVAREGPRNPPTEGPEPGWWSVRWC